MPSGAKALLLGALIGLLGMIASLPASVSAIETHLGLKLLFWLRGPRSVPPEVVIVSIDQAAADHFHLPNEPTLWPRTLHARAVQELSARGARVIVFDIVFSRPQNPEHDRMLAQALHEAGNVILLQRLRQDVRRIEDLGKPPAWTIHVERQQPLLPELADAAWGVAPFPLPKVPVRVDQCWLFKGSAGDLPTLPVVAFQAYALAFQADLRRLLRAAATGPASPPPEAIAEIAVTPNAAQVARRLRHLLRNHEAYTQRLLARLQDPQPSPPSPAQRVLSSLIELYAGENESYLDFYGPSQTVLTVPYHHLLDPATQGKSANSIDFSDKIVFIGFTEPWQAEQKDGLYTVFSGKDGVDLSGVEIAATAFANILEGRRLQPLKGWQHLALLAVFGIASGALLLLPVLFLPLVAGAIMVVYVSGAYGTFSYHGVWLPLAVPMLWQLPLAVVGTLLWHYLDTRRQHRQVQATFGYFVPKGVVTSLIRDWKALANSRRFVYGVCVATDAEQYTQLAETLSPDRLRSLLNRYYQKLFEPVARHGGFVSDVVGDAMLAIWADTMTEKKLRYRACCAALDIFHELSRWPWGPRQAALPTRFGLHAGAMVLGNIGAGAHFEYRAVGDAVNTAHRLEQLNKLLGTRILASAEVITGLEGVVAREIGHFRLTGKRRPILVYELVALTDEVDDATRALHVAFARALTTFRAQHFAQARQAFRQLLLRYPQDGPSRFYLELCQRFGQQPPRPDWDGIITEADDINGGQRVAAPTH
ncbi:MAG: CHASE2 domain-containing protein [Gammaproteobacteria bacterium]